MEETTNENKKAVYENKCPITGKVWISDKDHTEQKHYIDGAALIRVNATFWSQVAEYVELDKQPTSPKDLLRALTKKLGFKYIEEGLITLKATLESMQKKQEEPETAKADTTRIKKEDLNKDVLKYVANRIKANATKEEIIKELMTVNNEQISKAHVNFYKEHWEPKAQVPQTPQVPKAVLPNILIEKVN